MGNRAGGLLHSCRRQWLPILASRWRGGSGSGARVARQRGELNLGATGRCGSPRRLLYGGGRSAGGEQRWGQCPGVMVDGSRCGKVVHGAAVLMAVTGSSKGDRGRCYTVAQWRRSKAAQWRQWAGGRKAIHGEGGWAPFIVG
jgi:hypothetical protein